MLKKKIEKWEKQKKNWVMTDSKVGNIGLCNCHLGRLKMTKILAISDGST